MSARRPRVLFLTASYPTPERPLLGIFVREHARAAAAHADIAVVHLDRTDDVGMLPRLERGDDPELPAVRVRYPRRPAPLSYLGNLVGALRGVLRLRRRGFVPDVIHAHFFLAGIPAVLLGRILRTPVVVTEQWSVFLPDDPATLSPPLRRAARFAFERADLVLPVSEALRDGIRSLGVDARFRIVPNVVDTSRFAPAAVGGAPDGRPRTLVGVGALYDAKGWDLLIEAVALLAARRDDFRVEIVGDGDLRPALETLARERRVADRVSFRGWVAKHDVPELLRRADLFVLASRFDSNPCAVIEALASGLPVVATAVGGIPDLVRPGLGLLARPGSPESIAAQIAAALDEQGWDRTAIARAARERYGHEHVGRELATAYAEVIGRR